MPDVLIVHSDPRIRALLRAAVELEGYGCDEAEDGVIGWNMMRRSAEPLIVLLNDLLPDLGWHDLLFVIALDTGGAARHAYIITTGFAADIARRLDELPSRLLVSVAPLPFDANALAATLAQAAQRLAFASVPPVPPVPPVPVVAEPVLATPAVADAPHMPPAETAKPPTLRLSVGCRVSPHRDAAVEISVRTRPGAALTIQVRYGSGRKAQSSVLRGMRHADAGGCYSWRWTPRTAAGNGRARVCVTACWEGQRLQRVKTLLLAP